MSAVLLGAAVSLSAGEAPAQSSFVLRSIVVIDPAGSIPDLAADVTIIGGRIGSVATPSRDDWGEDDIDGTGQFLIPGLIDTHVHLTVPWYPHSIGQRLADAFMDGVTGVRDMGGHLPGAQPWIDRGADPEQATPRVYTSAMVGGAGWIAHQYFPPFFAAGRRPWLRAMSADADAGAVIRDAKAIGASGLKLTSGIDPRSVTRLAGAAHDAGMMVWAHAAIHPGGPADAVAAGVDVVSHAPLLAWEAAPAGWPGTPERTAWVAACRAALADPGPVDRLFTAMRERGTMLEPTLLIYRHLVESERREDPIAHCAAALAARAHAAQVPLLAGTDYLIAVGPHALLHDELEALVHDAGLSPRAALAAATVNAARGLGRGADLGRVAIGMTADLVVLRADPTIRISNARQIVAVIKRGRVFWRRARIDPAPHS